MSSRKVRDKNMRLLIIGAPTKKHVFILNFIKYLNEYSINTEIDILSLWEINNLDQLITKNNIKIHNPYDGYKRYLYKVPQLGKLYKLAVTKKKIRSLKKFDICHIHNVRPILGLISDDIRNQCKRLIASIYGSEFYQTSYYDKKLQENIYEQADKITFTNPMTIDDFLSFYNNKYRGKCSHLNYGSTILDKINMLDKTTQLQCRKKLGLPENSIIVTCGSNGNKLNQHYDIIQSITSPYLQLPSNIYFVFPMTYGCTEDYRRFVRSELEKTGLNYKLFARFLSDEDIAYLRKASDILIFVPQSDQFSAAMQEHLYAGNIVITGKWLPYNSFEEKGIHLIRVDSVGEMGIKLAYAIENLNNLQDCGTPIKNIIWELSSWEVNITKWIKFYNELLA
jgi:glycosyltransferase involved in cell wall biosynthesis